MSFHHAFDLPVTTVRPFNTYGPRQSARAIIPTIITQIAGGSREIRLGDLAPTRDLNFVKDVIKGFLAISECDETIGKEVNITSNCEISMGDLFDMIKKLMNSSVRFIIDNQRFRPKKSEVFRLCGDNRLICSLTGWKPQYSLEQGLMETISWFTIPGNIKKYKTDIYNL